jgi:AraC family transcriptional regulator
MEPFSIRAPHASPFRRWETAHPACGRLVVHRHASPYAALVLEGRYEELSADGRYACDPGMLVIHPAHHAHANLFGAAGARVLNVALPALGGDVAYRVVRPADPSQIERLMWSDPPVLAEALASETRSAAPHAPPAWTTDMARVLRDPTDDRGGSVSGLARSLGVSPAYASRGFKRHFGFAPAAFRREHRLRLALVLIRSGFPLADAALLAGFSDQSHLGRELRRATGRTPAAWRSGDCSVRTPVSRAEVNSILERFGP